MACCGQAQSNGAASMMRTADGGRVVSSMGLTYDDPVILGEMNGALTRVQVVVSGLHAMLRAGQTAWVTGSDVAALLANGSLLDLAVHRLEHRIWRVGSQNYLDYQQALDASAATGMPVVEVS